MQSDIEHRRQRHFRTDFGGDYDVVEDRVLPKDSQVAGLLAGPAVRNSDLAARRSFLGHSLGRCPY